MADKIEKIIEVNLKYDDLAKSAIKAQELIGKFNAELRETKKELRESGGKSKEAATKITELEVKIKSLRKEFNQYTSEIIKNENAETHLEGSINALSREVRTLTAEYNALSREERNAAEGEELEQKIANITKEINQANEKLLNFRGNVGNYRGLENGFTPLNFQVQQLVRELPSLTHSTTQFFLAISNNLPMLSDEIRKVIAQNKQLRSQGKPTVSVIKQIVGSLFSWQTALVAGITLLVACSDEIGEFIVSLFKGKEALDSMSIAMENVNKVINNGRLQAQEEITRLKLLNDIVQDVSNSEDKRNRALKALKAEYPGYIGNLSDEEIKMGALNGKMEEYIRNIENMAKGQAAMRKITENAEARMTLEFADGYKEFIQAYDALNGVYGPERRNLVRKREVAEKRFLDSLRKQGERGQKLATFLEEAYGSKLGINIKGYLKALEKEDEMLGNVVKDGLVLSPDEVSEIETRYDKTSSTLLNRLREQTQKLREEAFDLTLKFIEKQEETELEAIDRRRDHELAAIQEQIEVISSLKIGGVYKDGDKEVKITEDIYAELLNQREALEEKKVATAEAYARERANIEVKYAKKAEAEAEKAREIERKKAEARRRAKDRESKYAQEASKSTAELYSLLYPEDSIGAANMELEAAVRQLEYTEDAYDDLMNDFIKSGDDYSLWADAITEADNRVAESQNNVIATSNKLKDTIQDVQLETIDGFSAMAGAISSLTGEINENSGASRALAIVETGLSMASAIKQASLLPYPGNLVAIASVIGQFASIIEMIRSLNEESRNTYAQGGLIQVSENAGIIKGRSHAQGGVAVSLDGKKVAEVEDGELLAVVNKRDTAQLQSLSALNSIHGRKFAEGGIIDFSGIYSRMNIPIGRNIDTSGVMQVAGIGAAIVSAIRIGFKGATANVSVRDITTAQAKVKARDGYAKFKRKKIDGGGVNIINVSGGASTSGGDGDFWYVEA